MSYKPQFHEAEQTPAQRWAAVRGAICAGASDRAVPSQDLAQLGVLSENGINSTLRNFTDG